MISALPIPPPAQQLARFRTNRLREAVQRIGYSAESFRCAVNDANNSVASSVRLIPSELVQPINRRTLKDARDIFSVSH